MRRLLILSLLTLVFGFANGQNRTVTGHVGDENGRAIPFASILEKGTTNGTSADANGDFSITFQGNGRVLVITAQGFNPQETTVNGNTTSVVLLQGSSTTISEVVVTALGIRREKKALTYAAQTVSGENLNYSNNVDIASALAGKSAGVKLVGSPSSTFDNASLVIRGPKGLGQSDPLYVLDGNIVTPETINMDNIEDVTVLKGGAATALYGQRAAYGVIMLTSKKGKRGVGNSVEVKTGISFEKINMLPNYQNSYAGGYSSSLTNPSQYGNLDGVPYMDKQGWYKFLYDPTVHPAAWAAWDGQNILEYGADESWGPKIDGSTQYRPWYSWYTNNDLYGKTIPIGAQPNNVSDFLRTGRTISNSVALTSTGDNYNFRLSYNNQDRTLTQHNSKRMLHQAGLNGVYDISKRLTFTTDVQFSYDDRLGQPYEQYRNDGLNIVQGFNQWFQRQLDMKQMQSFQYGPDGRPSSWNIGDPNYSGDLAEITTPQYWDNPWWVVSHSYRTSVAQRLSGNVGLNVNLAKGLSWNSYVRRYSVAAVGDNRKGTGGLEQDYYQYGENQNSEMNYETNVQYKTNLTSAISLDALVGGNIRKNRNEAVSVNTNGGLSVPNYFNINASKDKASYSNSFQRKRVNSLFARATFGFNNYLFLDGTIRRDQSSSLPVENNTYYYPSVGLSLVFSDLMKGSDFNKVLTFGKIRGGFAQVGSDIGVDEVNTRLNAGVPFAGTPFVTYDNILRAGDIKPALQSTYEVGAELKFFNKFGIDFSWYQNDNTDQILNVNVPSATGFSSVQINAGKIQNKGWEVVLSSNLTKGENWGWDAAFNFAKASNKVVELARGLQTYLVATTWNDTRLEHRVGEEWGTVIGRLWDRDEKTGKVKIQTNGVPTYTTGNKIGNILPDYTGGFVNSIRYKGFDLSFNIDFQKGGLFFSSTRMFNLGTGLSQETVGLNDKGNDWRSFPSEGGGYKMEGVNSAGADVSYYIPARRYFYTILQRDINNFMYDASYVKMREIRLGFNMPTNAAQLVRAKSVNFSTFVTNPWLIYAKSKSFGIDPSELEGDFNNSIPWTEGGQLGQTRQVGASLKFTF